MMSRIIKLKIHGSEAEQKFDTCEKCDSEYPSGWFLFANGSKCPYCRGTGKIGPVNEVARRNR